MDIWSLRKWSRDANQRVILVIGSGILLSLFFFTLALAKRPGTQTYSTRTQNLHLGRNLGFTVLKGGPESKQRVPIGAPAASGPNCTNTPQYWRENGGNWPTDNLVVGKFTFQKEAILSIFQTGAQDEVTHVQQQFLAAALNILRGADSTKIESLMVESSAWLNDHPPKIDLTEKEKAYGMDLANRLADFNRGTTGPGACPGNPPEPSPTPVATQSLGVVTPEYKYSYAPITNEANSNKNKEKTLRGQGKQPDLPISPEIISTPEPASQPSATETTSPPVDSPGPVVSNPGQPQATPGPVYNPPPQHPVAPGKDLKESKGKSKDPKEKKNPNHPPKDQPPSPVAPSQPANPPVPPQAGSDNPAGSSNNGNGNGIGSGKGNGNGNGNGNGWGNPGGKGKGHGKKP